MRKVLVLTACLSLLLVTLFPQSPRTGARRAAQDELERRKARARTEKAQKTRDPAEAILESKSEARAAKSARPEADSAIQADGLESDGVAPSDILSQSEKSWRKKDVPQASLGRSLELVRTFDALASKAQSGVPVRLIVGLRADFAPEGYLPTPQAVKKQRAGIAAAQDSLLEDLPGLKPESLKRFETIPYVAFEADAAAVERLRSSPEVETVVEDVAVPPTLAESVALVGAPAAWAAGFSGSGQTVAVLDSGVDKTHGFLAGKVVSEACFSTNSFGQNISSVCPGGVSQSTSPGSGVPCSPSVAGCDHGTHVAGIAAGRGTSSSGVAREANLISVQVFSRFDDFVDCDGAAPCIRSFTSDQMKGLERVFALRGSFNIASVNMSLGGGRFSSNCDSNTLKPIIDNLRSVGVATVIASGNEGFKDSLASPACISTAISVGSTGDGSGATALNSVSGFSNSANYLNLLAPGNLIRSSVPGGSFDNFQGTSMAAPHVAGAWAVLKSKSPSATVTQVYEALRDTGLPVTDANGITKPRIQVDAAVNALGGGGGGGGSCGAPSPIGIGQTVNGALSSTDCRFPVGGDHFSDAYTFSGTAGQQIAVSMTSTAFDTFLRLIGPGGAQVAQDDDGGVGTNSRVPAESGFFSLPSTGTYTIQATSFSSNTSGTYTLNLTAQTPGGCTTPTPIALGQTINGSLSLTDCRFTDGSFFDAYTFSGVAGQQISVLMTSPSFDTLLFLLRPDGTLLADNDDGGGGTNSRIPPGSAILTLPSTGTYTIYANSFSSNVTGGYSLTLGGQNPGGGCPTTPISVGQTINGTLSSTDCRLSDDTLFDVYTFSGAAGQSISISMSSSAFDAYLFLLRPDGSLLAEDDDGGGNLNSRIPPSGTLTLPVSGTYKIIANSLAPNFTGGYSLTLGGSPPVSCPASPISFGQTLSRTLSTADCRFTDGSFFDAYTFSGAAGQEVAVTMTSLNFDTYLFLIGPNGLVVDDDDGGGGLNSRVPAGGGFFTLPSTGTYTILANSFASGVTGGYVLSLVASQASCSYSISPGSQSFGVGGGAGSVAVTAGGGCGWAAASNASWLSLTTAANGSGSGGVGFSVAANASTEPRAGTLTVAGRTFTVNQAGNTASAVQFTSSSVSVGESAKSVLLNVSRTGSTATAAVVNFATSDGTADRRRDYTQALGTLSFGVGETSKTIAVFVTDDTLAEPAETFAVTLSNPSGTTLGGQSALTVTINNNDATNGPNPVDPASFNSAFFVRQHYVDFLNREPDSGGLNFWTNEIESCGANQQCRGARRVNVSAAFFLSIEFQETGYLVHRMYKAAYGDTTSPNVAVPVPVIRLAEFLPDTQRIGRGVVVGQGDWPTLLENNKNAFALEFVLRQRFLTAFPATMTPAQFVDRLNQNAGGVLSAAARSQLISELTADGSPTGRASVLRKVAENETLRRNEFNRAFVLMQYFGYMRRNANDPQDTDFRGWKFWLDKLDLFSGNFVQAQMVFSFIDSIEYKQRFGP